MTSSKPSVDSGIAASRAYITASSSLSPQLQCIQHYMKCKYFVANYRTALSMPQWCRMNADVIWGPVLLSLFVGKVLPGGCLKLQLLQLLQQLPCVAAAAWPLLLPSECSVSQTHRLFIVSSEISKLRYTLWHRPGNAFLIHRVYSNP